MHLARRATGIACFIFAGALIGNALQWLLPAHHVADAKATIGMVQGLVTLLLALVLGLLVWTSYGVYAQQLSEAHSLGSQILQLVLALDRYGPAPRVAANFCARNSSIVASVSGAMRAAPRR